MQHGDRWQRALAEAEAVLGELRSSDRVMLVDGGRPSRFGRRTSSVAGIHAGTMRGSCAA